MKRGNQTNLQEVAKMRPLNVDLPDPYDADRDEKHRKRCPNCNQFHLRAGYCQALDPLNKRKCPAVLGAGE